MSEIPGKEGGTLNNRETLAFKAVEEEPHEASQSLREADYAHHFDVPRVGAQGIHGEVGPELDEGEVVFRIGGVQPFEGMTLVTQIGVQLRDEVGR